MSARIAIVDTRRDLVEFIGGQLVAQGYQIVTVKDLEQAAKIKPPVDLTLYDFTFPVDLPDLFAFIEEELRAQKNRPD